MDSSDFASLDEPWLSSPIESWKPWQPDPPSSDAPTTFKPTNLQVYAQHSRGLWHPTHQSTFIIMKSVCNHATLLTETIEPIAHCPFIEVAHQTLTALAQQYSNALLIENRMNEPEWGHFKIVGEKRTHTFWVKEVRDARGLKWTDLGVADDGTRNGEATKANVASGTADEDNLSDATTLDGAASDGTIPDRPAGEDSGAVQSEVGGELRRV
jgi:hypothetical protein